MTGQVERLGKSTPTKENNSDIPHLYTKRESCARVIHQCSLHDPRLLRSARQSDRTTGRTRTKYADLKLRNLN